MALIKCPECGGEVSDKAPQCIHCGYPLQQEVQVNEPADELAVETADAEPGVEPVIEPGAEPFAKPAQTTAKPKSKRKMIVGIVAAVLAMLMVAGAVWYFVGNSLSADEQYVVDVLKQYKSSLKDPDSMILRGDILFVRDYDKSNYTIFTASGNNSYGASVTSMPMFKDKRYAGDYYNEPSLKLEDYGDYSEYLLWSDAAYPLLRWNIEGEKAQASLKCSFIGLIDGAKIARAVGCKYKSE